MTFCAFNVKSSSKPLRSAYGLDDTVTTSTLFEISDLANIMFAGQFCCQSLQHIIASYMLATDARHLSPVIRKTIASATVEASKGLDDLHNKQLHENYLGSPLPLGAVSALTRIEARSK